MQCQRQWLQQATAEDAILQCLIDILRTGKWHQIDISPEDVNKDDLGLFMRVQSELTISSNSKIVLRGSRIVWLIYSWWYLPYSANCFRTQRSSRPSKDQEVVTQESVVPWNQQHGQTKDLEMSSMPSQWAWKSSRCSPHVTSTAY
jgi:hypothetical protein